MLAWFGVAWLCLSPIIDAAHFIGVETDVKMTDVKVELVFDITNNTAVAKKFSATSDFFEEVTTAIQDIEEVAHEMFKQVETTAVSISYLDGLEYFIDRGYIYPYENATEEDLKYAVPEDVERKFNPDGYDGIPNIIYLMVDDIGWNNVDFGVQESSTFLGAFPATRRLINDEGITLTNHISASYCSPARGQFLTGKYSSIIQMDDGTSQMHLKEATIAHEMKSAGYRTAHIGKWGVGWTGELYTPLKRGFDQSFGFLGNQAQKFWKTIDLADQEHLTANGYNGSFVDLWDNGNFAGFEEKYFMYGDKTREVETYLPFIFMDKFDKFIDEQVTKIEEGAKEPFFLYFASDLAHMPYVSPQYYLERCLNYEELNVTSTGSYSSIDAANKCAMLTILDETIANITCKLESAGMAENTLIVLASDNGGDLTGDNYPYLGEKFYEVEGGIKTPAAILGSMIPEDKKGSMYENLFHNTDWLPTLMHAATRGEWNHSVLGTQNVLNGVSHWEALMGNADERPRDSLITYIDAAGRLSILSYHNDKIVQYIKGLGSADALSPMISVELMGEPAYSCSSMTSLVIVDAIKGAKKMFLRASSTITDASVETVNHVRVPLALLVVALGLVIGVMVANIRARRETTPLMGKDSSPKYGAIVEKLQQ